MIGQLRGQLLEKQPGSLLIDVSGVGYLVQIPLSTFFVLPAIGQEITLRTHFIVREDAHLLYGFATPDECRLFQEIIKINGVGPKVALAILSGLSPKEFIALILAKESGALQKLPGIGAKTAQRIIVEMMDRAPKIMTGMGISQSALIVMQQGDPLQEAISALISLGYKPAEAAKAVKNVNSTQTCEQILKEALQGLARV